MKRSWPWTNAAVAIVAPLFFFAAHTTAAPTSSAALPVWPARRPAPAALSPIPARIPASERAEGFVFSKDSPEVVIVATEAEARAWTARVESGPARACFSTGDVAPARRLVVPRGRGVFVARREQLTINNAEQPDSAAAFEVTTALIDPQTHGTRAVDRVALPLVRLASGPSGLAVYAAREGASHRARFVVRAPDGLPSSVPATSPLWPLANQLSMRREGALRTASGCGHASLMLESTVGGGEMATVEATIFLPHLAGGDEHSIRTRPVHAHLSLSHMTGEASPVVAVALAFSGPEASYRIH